ncbi:DUF4240 domain-containing protein [Metabacillus sp. GX 13764]|uniref:DUF4240 domain-containing protein n=1 Tax=Metabacillus kandeliae TaxID=2900151 RepID=UPI001E42BE63|nr:DUF4240 domain-containing protein [Metabacillus kandeliae]
MDQKEFWGLVEKSKEHDNQAEWLTELLVEKGIEEVLDFEFIFRKLMNDSYQSRLWGAAYVLMGGCSDDSFDYFRGWLIGQGDEVFYQVMEDPEYLAAYINEHNLGDEGVPENEDLLAVGADAFTLIKTGDVEWDDEVYDELLEALDEKGLQPEPEIQFDWEEDDLEDLFPVLWREFGEEPLG